LSLPPLRLPFVSEAEARSISRTLEEPDWLLEQRLGAVGRVAELPAESNQLFTLYHDLRPVRFETIRTYSSTGTAGDAAEMPLPAGASALLSVRGDTIAARVIGDEARRAGVFVGTFSEALRERPDLLPAAIGSRDTLPADDAFAQVARAVWATGLLIHVPAGAHLDDPIVLRWEAGAPGRGLVSRTLVTLGDGAHARLLEEQVGSNGDPAGSSTEEQRLWWGTTELILGPGATLDVSGLQEFDTDTVAFVNRHAIVDTDAHLRWALASVGSLLHKSRIDNQLDGRGASVHQAEIAFGDAAQVFDLTSYTRHRGEDTTGDLLSKGVFSGRSRGYIKGLIEIQRSATGTDSFLGEFAMLLARKARSVTIPSLEIDQPNVRRASHASSVAPIDETQTFYLMSRGLDRETARKTIVLGFLEPVVARIPLPEVQDRLRALLDAKWPRVAAAAA